MSQLWRAFNASEEDFQAEFEFPKPAKDASNLVLQCLSGKRATDAADKLALLGYAPAVYKGSFKDWKEKGGKVSGGKKGKK